MSEKVRPRVKVPKTAKKGEMIDIKTTISHKMESGRRKDKKGELIPRQILNKFQAHYNGELVMEADMHPAVSANPYIQFTAVAKESGEFVFTWNDDDGSVYEAKAEITVT